MKNSIHIKKFIKKHLITIWLVVATVSFCGIFVYAKFSEGQNYTKRVVSTGKNDKVLFTSNLLSTSNTKHPKTVAKGYNANSTFDINVYNYDRNKPSSFYQGTINYTLKAELVKTNGTTKYDLTDSGDLDIVKAALIDIENSTEETKVYKTVDVYELVNGVQGNNPVLSLGTSQFEASLTTEKLTPDSSGSAVKSYRVVIPKEAIDSDVYVRILAEPNGYSDLPTSISGVFFVQAQNINVTNGWKGEFVDNRSIAPSGYDAFNFRISGAGTENKVLKWNNDYVQPNKQQISELFGETLAASTSQLSYSFPLQAEVYSYDIQFYVKNEAARTYIDGLSWEQLIAEGIITLEDPT